MLGGFLGGIVLVWHATYTINSLAHVIGRTRYETGDSSKNSALLALLTLGEGWHNNHHYYQASARQGFFWWEIDVTYYVLKALSFLKIVHGLKVPPKRILEGTRRKRIVGLKSASPSDKARDRAPHPTPREQRQAPRAANL